jgi:type II secretory pathway pseudopilin PulG
MFVRRRPILRTAMVGGVAYAAGSHVAKKSAEQEQLEAQQNAQIADLQQQQATQATQQQQAGQQPPPPPYQQPVYQQPAAPPPAAAPTPASGVAPETLEQLKQLGELHTSGVLTDDEFEAAKQKILGQL